MAIAESAMKQIKKGAFLTVLSIAGLNTMTIGWATIGFVVMPCKLSRFVSVASSGNGYSEGWMFERKTL